jgi:hypothetical protein
MRRHRIALGVGVILLFTSVIMLFAQMAGTAAARNYGPLVPAPTPGPVVIAP